MQSQAELDIFYLNNDPWGFANNPEDLKRKLEILAQIKWRYKRALDLGCGEGWITKDINADEIHGYELSTLAARRCPENVHIITQPFGKYDLILACGIMYKHYDWKKFIEIIKKHATDTIITCNIASWEVEEVAGLGKQVFMKEFPYREYTQRLRVFEALS